MQSGGYLIMVFLKVVAPCQTEGTSWASHKDKESAQNRSEIKAVSDSEFMHTLYWRYLLNIVNKRYNVNEIVSKDYG